MGGVSMEWKVFSLSDIAHYSQGKQIPLNLQYLELNELRERFIRIVDFTSNWSQEPRFVDKDPKYLVNIDDIVMIRYGTPGKVFRGHKGIIANNLLKITFNEEIIDKDYAYWYLNQDSVYKQLMAGQSSSTMPAITFGMLKYIMVRVPPISYQRRIASILSSLDRKIELNNKINADLEEMAQAIFKNWFVDFEPFKDGKFVDSELGMIPEGWKVSQIADIPHILETGKRPKGGAVEKGIPSVGAEHVKGMCAYDYSKTKYINCEFAAKLKTGKINGYELMIYKDGGKPGYFIPNFSIFGEGYPFENCYLNEHVFKLDFDGNKEFNIFCYFFFKTEQIMSYFNAQGAKAAIPGINKKDVENIYIFSPDNESVIKFGEFAYPLFKQMLKNAIENRTLSLLRDTLLPRLMSGEIEVQE